MEVALVDLCLVEVEAVLGVLAVLHHADEYALHVIYLIIDHHLFCLLIDLLVMLVEFDLFPLEAFGVAFAKTEFFIVPVVHDKG